MAEGATKHRRVFEPRAVPDGSLQGQEATDVPPVASVIHELARAKAVFQLRAISAALNLPHPIDDPGRALPDALRTGPASVPSFHSTEVA